jgi:hypothetical protein
MTESSSGSDVPNGHQAAARQRVETADYIAELSADLAKMARLHRLDTLGYLLEMVELEAKSTVRLKNGR